MKLSITLFIFVTSVLFLTSCRFTNNLANGRLAWSAPNSDATEADRLANMGQYQEAILLYQKHMQARRRDSKRPSDENPSFYHLLIGDLFLKMNNPETAAREYESAKKDGVDSTLVINRYRKLASYFAEKKQFEKALSVLKKNRALDPDVFDAEIDTLHKSMVAYEDKKAPTPKYQY